MAQYLILFTESRDGLPFDYNQARVFTWNAKRDRYEHGVRALVADGIRRRALRATDPTITTRVKMGQSSNIVALVKADGKYYVAAKEVKVTLGGCGG